MQAHIIFMLYSGRTTLWDGGLRHENRVSSHSLCILEMCLESALHPTDGISDMASTAKASFPAAAPSPVSDSIFRIQLS